MERVGIKGQGWDRNLDIGSHQTFLVHGTPFDYGRRWISRILRESRKRFGRESPPPFYRFTLFLKL